MRCHQIFVLKIICLALICGENGEVGAKIVKKRGVMENFNEGLKYAGQMFGINTAADVANLVAKAFSSTASKKKPDVMSLFQKPSSSYEEAQDAQQEQPVSQEQQQQETQQQNERYGEAEPAKEDVGVDFSSAKLIGGMLRMIGFDATKLGALAINALIMIAQAIGSTLMSATKTKRVVNAVDGGRLFTNKDSEGPEALYADDEHQPRALRDGTPIDWFLQTPNKQLRRMINDITDRNLSHKLTDMIEQLETEAGQGACLKMLMCKSAPFIWGMQKSLSVRLDAGKNAQHEAAEEEPTKPFNARSFFTHMPSIAEYREHGQSCEAQYAQHCNITDIKPTRN